MRSPPAFKPPNSTFRPTLPSLPFLSLDRRSSTEYALEASRPTTQQQSSTYASSLFNPAQSNPYVPAPFPYGYQQPRASSLSSSASHHHFPPDRTPFSNAAHHHSYMGSIPYANDMVETPEAKQRKRRGNLPKQTTDILRTWFHAHLQHPYPTEDEKQDLMRQTNLQMSKFFHSLHTYPWESQSNQSSDQISNWFINARRRVLPTLQNQARAEEHARLSMTNERNGQSISSKTDNAHNQWDDVDARSRTSKSEPSDSDGEGSGYDDDAGRRHTWWSRSRFRLFAAFLRGKIFWLWDFFKKGRKRSRYCISLRKQEIGTCKINYRDRTLAGLENVHVQHRLKNFHRHTSSEHLSY